MKYAGIFFGALKPVAAYFKNRTDMSSRGGVWSHRLNPREEEMRCRDNRLLRSLEASHGTRFGRIT